MKAARKAIATSPQDIVEGAAGLIVLAHRLEDAKTNRDGTVHVKPSEIKSLSSILRNAAQIMDDLTAAIEISRLPPLDQFGNLKTK